MAHSMQEARPVQDLLPAAPLRNGGLEEQVASHSTATAASSGCPDASVRKAERMKLGEGQLGHTCERAATKGPSPAKSSTLPSRIPFDHRLAARLAAARSAEARQMKPHRILMKTKYGRMGESSAVSKLQIELRSSKESNDALTAEVNTLRRQVGAQEAELASSSSLIAQLRRQVAELEAVRPLRCIWPREYVIHRRRRNKEPPTKSQLLGLITSRGLEADCGSYGPTAEGGAWSELAAAFGGDSFQNRNRLYAQYNRIRAQKPAPSTSPPSDCPPSTSQPSDCPPSTSQPSDCPPSTCLPSDCPPSTCPLSDCPPSTSPPADCPLSAGPPSNSCEC